jgi:branched-chain amino acid transport system permease protein
MAVSEEAHLSTPPLTADDPTIEPALQRSMTVQWIPLAACLLILALLPTLAGSRSIVLPIALLALVYAVIAQCWNLVIGFSGIFSVAQVALFGIGGYASAAAAIHLGSSVWVGLVIGGLAAVVAALVIGVPILRLAGIYVALLTLAFSELVRNFVTTGPEALGRGVGLDSEQFFVGSEAISKTYYVGLALFVITTWAVWRVVRSPVGMGFQAMRDAEPYALGRGVPRLRMRVFLFAYSAFFTGVAGAFYAGWQGVVAPSVFDFQLLFTLLMALVLGGWGTLLGPIVGVGMLITLNEGILRTQDPILQGVVYGTIVVAVVIMAPRGIVGMVSDAFRPVRRYFDQFE